MHEQVELPETSNYLPATLKSLELCGCHYRAAGLLPSVLEDLNLKLFVNTLRVGDLPFGLHTLFVGTYLDHSINLVPGVFPASLRYLKIMAVANEGMGANIFPEGLLQFSVTIGDISFEVGSLPASLRLLGLADGFVRALSSMSDIFATIPNFTKSSFTSLHPGNGYQSIRSLQP